MESTSQITCFDIVSLTIQAIAAFATVFAVRVSLHDSRQAKRIHDEDLKKDQATKVSCWFEETESCEPAPQDDSHVWQNIVLQNESNCPVYNVIVTCVATQGAGPHSKGEDNDPEYPDRLCIGTLPPGRWSQWLPTGGRGMHITLAPEVAFTDVRGISWVRRGNGNLETTKDSLLPQAFYRIANPVEWSGCRTRNH